MQGAGHGLNTKEGETDLPVVGEADVQLWVQHEEGVLGAEHEGYELEDPAAEQQSQQLLRRLLQEARHLRRSDPQPRGGPGPDMGIRRLLQVSLQPIFLTIFIG